MFLIVNKAKETIKELQYYIDNFQMIWKFKNKNSWIKCKEKFRMKFKDTRISLISIREVLMTTNLSQTKIKI